VGRGSDEIGGTKGGTGNFLGGGTRVGGVTENDVFFIHKIGGRNKGVCKREGVANVIAPPGDYSRPIWGDEVIVVKVENTAQGLIGCLSRSWQP